MKAYIGKIIIIILLLVSTVSELDSQCLTGTVYYETFDNGLGQWVIGGVSGSVPAMYDQFEHGKVTSSNYAYWKADTTDLYFKTDMGGVYSQETHTWVNSPCFDFSSYVVPILNVDVYADALEGFHGASLQYSTDGTNWTSMGSCFTGTNWYDNLLLTGEHCWANTGGDWTTASFDITFLAGYSNVYFKFVFKAGIIPAVKDGFAFDNFEIFESAGIYSPEITQWLQPLNTACQLSNNESVSVEVTNYGTQNLSGFYLRYLVGGYTSAWEYVTTTIQPGGTLNYTFNNAHNFSSNGSFNCTAQFSENGSTVINSFEYSLHADGLFAINSFPFSESFSSGSSSYFEYETGQYAQTNITGGELVMKGVGNDLYWSGGSFTTTSEMAWIDNAEYKSTVYNCHIDATANSNLELIFDLWQDFSYGPAHSWFRVLVNDVPVPDVNGLIDHQLGTYESAAYNMMKYDLSQWAGTTFQIKFEAVTKLEADVIKIDNLEVRDKFPYDLEVRQVSAPTSGCDLETESIMFEFKNIGTSSASGFSMQYTVNGGPAVTQPYSGSIAAGATEIFTFSSPYDFSNGGTVNIQIVYGSDYDQSNNSLTGYVVEDLENDVTTPYLQDFNPPNVIYSDNWVIEDFNNDGEEWGWYTDANGNQNYVFDFEGAVGNDYLFTTCFNLDATIFYNLHFLYSTWIATSGLPKHLDVYLSTSQSVSGIIGSPIVSFSNMNTYDQYQSYDDLLNVSTTGVYYFAFKVSGSSTLEAEYVMIDNLQLSRFVAPDLSIINLDFGSDACVMTTNQVNISIMNLLGGVVGQGNSLEVTYSLNGGALVSESVYLAQPFYPGDIINYTFTQTVDLSQPGVYTLVTDVNYIYESNPSNDTNTETITHYGYPNVQTVFGLDSGLCLNAPDINITGAYTAQSWENPCVESFITGMPFFTDNGNGTATFSPVTLGTFPTVYSVTNVGGCSTPLQVDIPITNPYVNLGPDICTYDYTIITLDAGPNPNYSFEWSTGVTTQTMAPPFYGHYWVDATEEACTYRDSLNVYIDQEIEFHLGWGIWSTYVDVNSMPSKDMGIVTSPLSDLVITKDEEGRFWWPAIPINTIGDMINGEGYQYKMDLPNVLYLCGDLLVPELTPITLKDGYNYMGYLRLLPSPVDFEMTQSGITGLVYVKDEDGNIYWPAFSLNLIGNFLPGKGYQVKMEISQPVDFYYSPN